MPVASSPKDAFGNFQPNLNPPAQVLPVSVQWKASAPVYAASDPAFLVFIDTNGRKVYKRSGTSWVLDLTQT